MKHSLRNAPSLFVLGIILLIGCRIEAAQTYVLVDLGTLGGDGSIARGINDAGQIMGYMYDSQGSHPVFWASPNSAGVILGLPDNAVFYDAPTHCINNSGQMIGDGGATPLFWANSSNAATTLNVLSAYGSVASGINDLGQIVGSGYKSGTEEDLLFWFNNDYVPVRLDQPADSGNVTSDINNIGQIIGNGSTNEFANNAIFWANSSSTAVILQTFGGQNGDAYALNDSGQIVGTATTAQEVQQVAFWASADSTPVQLAGFGGGRGDFDYASDINIRGQIVGTLELPNRDSHAVLWTNSTSPPVDLNDLIDPNSGWVLDNAAAINSAGVIVGNGHIGQDFNEHGFALVPSAPPPVGSVTNLHGNVTVVHGDGTHQKLHNGDSLIPGDVIDSGAGSGGTFTLNDGTRWTMSENGKISVDEFAYDPPTHEGNAGFHIFGGLFRYVSGLIAKRPDDNVHIDTSLCVGGIRGTEFISRLDPCATTQEVYLIHGQLAIEPHYSSVTNIVDAPATIMVTASNVVTSALTQDDYDALLDEVNRTNPVTFASWQVEHFGCTNDNPSAAADADPDGDGQNNYAEFLTHTDPVDSASAFRLVGGVREDDSMRLIWKTHGGITNVVQAAFSLNGIFTDISSCISIPGDDDLTTNYLDPGAVTNAPHRFYRIRLGH